MTEPVIEVRESLLPRDAGLGVALEVIESSIELGALLLVQGQFRINLLGRETIPEILGEFDAFGGSQAAEIKEGVRRFRYDEYVRLFTTDGDGP